MLAPQWLCIQLVYMMGRWRPWHPMDGMRCRTYIVITLCLLCNYGGLGVGVGCPIQTTRPGPAGIRAPPPGMGVRIPRPYAVTIGTTVCYARHIDSIGVPCHFVSILGVQPAMPKTLRRPERDAYFKVETTGCWKWLGYLDSGGVPIVYVDSRRWTARRWLWVGATGQYPTGKLVALCNTNLCVRPAHMNKAAAAGIVGCLVAPTGAQRQAAWRAKRPG